jgi:hypothetical protein
MTPCILEMEKPFKPKKNEIWAAEGFAKVFEEFRKLWSRKRMATDFLIK